MKSITTAEAARRLGVSAQTVQKWVDIGSLPAWKTLGGHRRIDADAVDAMLRGRRTSGARRGGLSALLLQPDTVRAQAWRHALLQMEPAARVRIAHDAFDALLDAGREVPDMLLSAARLPGLDIGAMVARLREHPVTRRTRVVLVCDGAEAPACASPCLSDPVTAAALRQALTASTPPSGDTRA